MLYNGLNFGFPDSRKVLEGAITHLKNAIQYMPDTSKENQWQSIQVKTEKTQIIKRLRQGGVFYLKAHKGNQFGIFTKVIIMRELALKNNNGP